MRTYHRQLGIGLAFVVTVSAGLLAPGCGSSEKSEQSPALRADTPPMDFALALTVYPKPGASRRAALPPERRPARYVLEPDWVLRAAVGSGVQDQTYPTQTRRLTPDEVNMLWRELRDSGLLEPAHPAIVGRVVVASDDAWSHELDSAPTAPPACSVFYVADGVKRTLALQSGDDAPALGLVKKLAELAWVGK